MADWQDYLETAGAGYHTVVGTLKVLKALWSPQRGNWRDILVHLPPSYGHSSERYPVIYMHDGQNLFDQATSFAGEWHVDEIMQLLSLRGYEAIVVGLPNVGRYRLAEYSPFKDPRYGGGQGDAYLAFIIETVKPLIDQEFLTLPDQAHTGIFGSSMGGLISLYAYFRHPQIFGLAGVMSPSLWFARGAIFDFVEKAACNAGKIYLDSGAREQTHFLTNSPLLKARLSHYHSSTQALSDLLYHKGYRPGEDLLYLEDEEGEHNEAAWARRLPDALQFLLS
jgi:predicted alpha/beta superfamily hydrolase